MNTKSIIAYLAPVVIAGVLVSCGSSNQVASSFGKRKYTKGIFTQHRVIPDNPARNTASVVSPKSSGPVTVPTITSTTNVADAPVLAMDEKKTTVATSNNAKSTGKVFSAKTMKAISVTENAPVVASNSNSSLSSSNTEKNAEVSAAPANSGSMGGGGGNCKSWIAAVLLCFFLGGLGIHRFYLGYTWQGVVQLLTGGGCGIWALIDFIRILMKSLKPKNGDYCE